MPASKKSKGKGGKRGEKTGGDSVSDSKKPKTREEEGFTVAERCTTRLGRQSKAKRNARDNRDLKLGEQVIRNPLIRDTMLQHFNPFKLSDLRSVLRLREFYGLLPDIDLKECYFERAWGFRKDEFVLAGWREMSVEAMRRKVKWAHPYMDGRDIYPSCKVDVDTLDTKEDIVRAFWELTYVPRVVYQTAVAGVHVLGLVEAGKVGENAYVPVVYLEWACRAGLDASVIRGLACLLAGKWGRGIINEAARQAVVGGHTDVVDLLASEFGAGIDMWCLTRAAECGHDAMIDHLVERYGLNPNVVNQVGWTALHCAAESGHVRTVQHLVEKHNVDIHARSRYGKTALDFAEEFGRTECASYLRSRLS
jgi:hypothetical protein